MRGNRWSHDDPNDPLSWHLDDERTRGCCDANAAHYGCDPLTPQRGDRRSLSRGGAKTLIARALTRALGDIHRRLAAMEQTITAGLAELRREEHTMGEKTAAALAELKGDLVKVRDGWASLVAERDALKAALAGADATKAQAVADALAADDTFDEAAIHEADAVVHDLVNQADQPPADQPPASEPAPGDGVPAEQPPADGSAPADGSSGGTQADFG